MGPSDFFLKFSTCIAGSARVPTPLPDFGTENAYSPGVQLAERCSFCSRLHLFVLPTQEPRKEPVWSCSHPSSICARFSRCLWFSSRCAGSWAFASAGSCLDRHGHIGE